MDKAIIFIDYDNVWITCNENYSIDVLEEDFINKTKRYFSKKGYYLTEIIAYGNYDNGKMLKDKHQTQLQSMGIQTKHAMNGKDSADISIICDALEKLYTNEQNNDTYIFFSCDRDITSLINKIKARGKKVFLVTFTINIDWDVMKNYGDFHEWFEKILGIPYKLPDNKPNLDKDLFIEELDKIIKEKKSNINYSLFANSLEKKYNTDRTKIDNIKDCLVNDEIVEIYSYDFFNKNTNRKQTFRDGIRKKY